MTGWYLGVSQVVPPDSVQQVLDCGLAAGSANAIQLTLSGATLSGNRLYMFRASAANTTAVTIVFNGSGAKSLVYKDGTAIPANALQASGLFVVLYNTNQDRFELVDGQPASQTQAGVVFVASATEVLASTLDTKAVTPLGMEQITRQARNAAAGIF